MAAKNSSIDKMILRIAVSINKLLYNYINFSVFSERANFSPVRVRREFFYQLPMALVVNYHWCGGGLAPSILLHSRVPVLQ